MTWVRPRTHSDWIKLPSYIYIKFLSTFRCSGWPYGCNNRTGMKVSAFIKDSNRVCPVFFEQGQATSGGLALCSKITLVVLPPPAAISKTAALGTENSPNCRGKSISPWFFFSEWLSCAPLFFRTSFLCGFKTFPPRQKSNARCLYIFFGAP